MDESGGCCGLILGGRRGLRDGDLGTAIGKSRCYAGGIPNGLWVPALRGHAGGSKRRANAAENSWKWSRGY